MKKTIATVIVGLFASAAFAQTPAPATAPKADAKVEKTTTHKTEKKVKEATPAAETTSATKTETAVKPAAPAAQTAPAAAK